MSSYIPSTMTNDAYPPLVFTLHRKATKDYWIGVTPYKTDNSNRDNITKATLQQFTQQGDTAPLSFPDSQAAQIGCLEAMQRLQGEAQQHMTNVCDPVLSKMTQREQEDLEAVFAKKAVPGKTSRHSHTSDSRLKLLTGCQIQMNSNVKVCHLVTQYGTAIWDRIRASPIESDIPFTQLSGQFELLMSSCQQIITSHSKVPIQSFKPEVLSLELFMSELDNIQ